ncbi:MAG: hypothetical protein JW888_12525, partial [Pirellulales bacterium]|nr:hypothetical protein [Pirellulales bacterium]
MGETQPPLPLLPLVLDDVPAGLGEMLVQEGVPFRSRRREPLAGRFVLFDSRRTFPEAASHGQTWIDVDRLRAEPDGDPFAKAADWRSARFEWHVDNFTLAEEIARVDRRALRRRVLGRLRRLVEEAGGIWLAVSAYPFPYRSAFHFRIDYDEYDPNDFDATLRAIAGRERCTSHFVNGANYESIDEAWARLRGLDVGSHGYWHHTYRTASENTQNIRRGIEVVRRAGIEPRGFIAPHGRFSLALNSVMTELGISHSGEFGAAYDELPLRPAPGGPLQIPVHPVCLGLFLDAAERGADQAPAAVDARRRVAAEAAGDYFDRLIRDRYRSGEPIFLYGHPTRRLGRYPDVLRGVLRTADSLAAVWKTNASDWVDWWQARRRLRLKVTRDAEQLV